MPEPSPLLSYPVSVRELVETAPASVTDDWCRQLAGDLLRAVELQHAMGRPHQLIMPDTVLVHAGGAAELLASLDGNADFQSAIGADLKAIAAVLHFAISGESPPGAALVPRGLTQFSDCVLETIDACLYGERQRRPQSVAAMRSMLGLAAEVAPVAPVAPVVEVAAVAAVAAVTDAAGPAQLAEADDAASPAALASVVDELEQAIASLTAAVGAPADAPAEALPAVAPAERPEVQSEVTPGPKAETAPGRTPAPALLASAGASASAGARAARASRTPQRLLACLTFGLLGVAAYGLYEKGVQDGAAQARTRVPDLAPAAVVAPVVEPVVAAPLVGTPSAPGSAAGVSDTSAAGGAATVVATRASATYKLSIKPWGEVWVDGVRRGISPPLKSLTLTGPHTIRIDHPDFPSRELRVAPGKDSLSRITHEFE